MAAPKGNEFWKLAPSTGRKPMYSDPADLEKDCFDYFEQTSQRKDWNKQNWVGKTGREVAVKVQTPFTISGLQIFLGMSDTTWGKYREKEAFVGVITHVEKIIYTQKFEGAVAGHYNANIIARDLGLSDKKEIDHSSLGDKLGAPQVNVYNTAPPMANSEDDVNADR